MGSNIATLADEFGRLKVQIAELETREAAIKAELIALGDRTVEGEQFVVSVAKTVQERLDVTKLRRNLSPQQIAANTLKIPVVRVTVKARLESAA